MKNDFGDDAVFRPQTEAQRHNFSLDGTSVPPGAFPRHARACLSGQTPAPTAPHGVHAGSVCRRR